MSDEIDRLAAGATDVYDAGGRFAVVDQLGRCEPRAAAEAYCRLQRDFYWKRKDLPAVIAVSHAGIQHAIVNSDGDQALWGIAKRMAYDLASFTWPGWDEPSIVIGRAELEIGAEAARFNEALAERLDRPPQARANAAWIIGAHQLAAGERATAAATFDRGAGLARVAAAPVLEAMLLAYRALCHALVDPDSQPALDIAMASLRDDTSADAAEFARQIEVARTVFLKSIGDRPWL